MWVRQCDLDAQDEAPAPIPSRIASNEEFVPPPQSPEQREYEHRLIEISAQAARRQGLNRRDFLRTGSGMAAAFVALNQVFGDCYDVSAAEVEDQKAFAEKWPKDQFIFDVQTHHVDVSHKWYDESVDGKRAQAFFRALRPTSSLDNTLDLLNRAHYVKEVFGDSDTVMAIISGVPSREWDKNPLPPDQMVATRKFVNDLAGSQRVLSHGLLRPNLGQKEMEEMERQVKELKIDAWKMYTGAELGENAWYMDDEKVAYPFWEKTAKLGIKNLCVHKGLPLSVFNEKACTPHDLEKAALDWPQLNFIAYHSGFRGYGPLLGQGLGPKVTDKKTDDPQEIPWISDILRILKRNPKIKNIYFELGATFNMTSARSPETCMHMLGQMIQAAGADHILWGTDSIWGGSPQSQIERLRRLKMKPELQDKYHYTELSAEVKKQIFGLNAARLFGIDPNAKRNEIKADKLTELRKEYEQNPAPSNTQYGWIWVEDGREPTAPVGT
jgi:predicted TIM-barrel fold metal-dependent hydrolase